jgi:hypothetical protein
MKISDETIDELREDFEILIIAWLKSGNENTANIAYSLVDHATKKLNEETLESEITSKKSHKTPFIDEFL